MMRVFVAGATGAIGKQLVPRLVAGGHEVHGMTRSESKQAMLRELGAVPVVADALDPDQVADAVGRARPEVIVHELTAIGALDMRHFDRDFALTNRLRTEGPTTCSRPGRRSGYDGSWHRGWGHTACYTRTGGRSRPRRIRSIRRPCGRCARPWPRSVISSRRSSVREWTEGIVLRYGVFYGPGTSMAPGEEQFELVRRRKFPLVGDGGGVWSFIHVADAAEATVAAIEHGSRGVYNVVDDDPGAGRGVAAGARSGARRQAADACAAVRWAAVRRRGRGGDDDRGPRRVEREGQARAGVAPGAPELAAGVRGGMTGRQSRFSP